MAIVGLGCLYACNLDPRADDDVAVGAWPRVRDAAAAAKRCGVSSVRFDPLDDQLAVLLIDARRSQAATDCTYRWIRKFAPEIELTDKRRVKLGIS